MCTVGQTDIEEHFIDGSLNVKLPTKWTDGKAEVGRVRKEQKKEDQSRIALKKEPGVRKGRKLEKNIHPASAGLFWSVTRANGGVDHEDQIQPPLEFFQWVLFSLSPSPWGFFK